MQEFQVFKKEWTERMVEFLIRELEINEEGAREARKNPDSFYINYETYKLFTSSIWYFEYTCICSTVLIIFKYQKKRGWSKIRAYKSVIKDKVQFPAKQV